MGNFSPYFARISCICSTLSPKGCVESCNLCVNRIDHGSETTACEDACNKAGHSAITFGDLKNPTSKVRLAIDSNSPRRLRNDLNLQQKVFYSNI